MINVSLLNGCTEKLPYIYNRFNPFQRIWIITVNVTIMVIKSDP